MSVNELFFYLSNKIKAILKNIKTSETIIAYSSNEIKLLKFQMYNVLLDTN